MPLQSMEESMKMLSIIIPVYNEEQNISHIVEKLDDLLKEHKITYEIIFIDDGSKDRSWNILASYHDLPYITSLRFSRNFGKEAAIFAGLKHAKGDACVVMDCDMQHPPKVIIEMYELWLTNQFDIIEARKTSTGKETKMHSFFAKLFYKLLKSTSGMNLEGASDFKLLDRKVIHALNQMPEKLTFFRALSSWVGFRTTQVYFEVGDRFAGETKWSFMKLLRYSLNSIASFSTLPMQLVTLLGSIFFIFSIILGINTLYNLFSGTAEVGFTTVILLLLIIGSVIMFSLGVIGYYLSKIYEEVKARPKYIVAEIISGDKEEM